jgi:hypothetical protein
LRACAEKFWRGHGELFGELARRAHVELVLLVRRCFVELIENFYLRFPQLTFSNELQIWRAHWDDSPNLESSL